MSTAIRERLSSEGVSNLRTAAVLEFTEEVFESDNYRTLEVLTPELHYLYIVNINDRTLTILTISEDLAVTKETLFTDRIISMKEYFDDYSLVDNTPPHKLEMVFLNGTKIEIEPGLSKLHAQNYQEPSIVNQVSEEFEHLIAAIKNTIIL
ncbi:hypothetical protein MUN89_17250 [Halobacillus salinarum]|uniref:Uncharacterized protein n=1 Tax=Halobacillus salinarum TaxID=2932257 RepID=A0ABY4EHU2_9BACI|nr:hypothetical protein [Halobacillus salinarum]UOQ43633.1 hypothetical protein MUN89_17250 [Halobacillus salinarum]